MYKKIFSIDFVDQQSYERFLEAPASGTYIGR